MIKLAPKYDAASNDKPMLRIPAVAPESELSAEFHLDPRRTNARTMAEGAAFDAPFGLGFG